MQANTSTNIWDKVKNIEYIKKKKILYSNTISSINKINWHQLYDSMINTQQTLTLK